MPSWKIHEKWCQILGVEKSICQEVNRIVDRPPHDIEDQLLRKGKGGWPRNLFESGQATTRIRTPGGGIEQLSAELAEITNRLGEEGIKATFNHLALDYIAELIELGYSKEGIRERLIKKEVMDYIPYYDQVFDDISRETKPIGVKIQRRKEFEKLGKIGLFGVFMINGRTFHPVPAVLHMKSELKKGRAVSFKWGNHARDAERGEISRTLYEIEDLEELINEWKRCLPNLFAELLGRGDKCSRKRRTTARCREISNLNGREKKGGERPLR